MCDTKCVDAADTVDGTWRRDGAEYGGYSSIYLYVAFKRVSGRPLSYQLDSLAQLLLDRIICFSRIFYLSVSSSRWSRRHQLES